MADEIVLDVGNVELRDNRLWVTVTCQGIHPAEVREAVRRLTDKLKATAQVDVDETHVRLALIDRSDRLLIYQALCHKFGFEHVFLSGL